MKKAEELCIKYLMHETNAEEEAELREAMQSDADVLIEYESLKSSWMRIAQLPQLTPPATLTESVVQLAAQREVFDPTKITQHWAAAAVVATISLGAWGIYQVSEPVINYFAQSDKASKDHWVDRNDMIYIQPNHAALSSGTPTVNENFKKLKPVDPESTRSGGDQNIQLAGSKKAN